MTLTRGKYLAAALCGAIAVGLVVAAPGCTEECIDRFDCVGKGAAGEFLVCENNKCVPGTPPAVEDAGTGEDAGGGAMDAGGTMDAGEMDAGTMDAGEMDGGTTDGGEMDAGPTDAGLNFVGAVYTMSNDATDNKVFVYKRADTGVLVADTSYSTGGTGTGKSLSDQGAIAYDSANKRLFVVNAGDNTLSMMTVNADGSLTQTSKVASGGTDPISVTVNGNTVYVLNRGFDPMDGGTVTTANITGFSTATGMLVAIPLSTQPLSAGNPDPAEVAFSPDGKLLVVTERGTNKITTFKVTAGVAGAANAQTSVGNTPYGFAFDSAGHLIVTEAEGGTANASTVSSYTVNTNNGNITNVTASAPTHQTAACWMATANGYAWSANAGTPGTITGFKVSAGGALTELDPTNGLAATVGGGPVDEAITPDGKFLYVLNRKTTSINVLAIEADGGLTPGPDLTGIPAQAHGLIAQ